MSTEQNAINFEAAPSLVGIRFHLSKLNELVFATGIESKGYGSDHPQSGEPIQAALLASQLYKERSCREKYFDGDFFGEAAWNILLDLYIQTSKDRAVSVTSSCIASGVPATTALRWVSVLVDRGLINRIEDAGDRRRAFLRLTPCASQKIEEYLKEIDRVLGRGTGDLRR